MKLLWLLLASPFIKTMAMTNIVSESPNRLPMSLSTVIADLEAEGHQNALQTACLVTSRSVTQRETQDLLKRLLQVPEAPSSKSKVVATGHGLALATPHSLEEVVQSCVACQGLVVFFASSVDLSRGEGLMDALAPAMERLQQFDASAGSTNTNKPCLVVVYDDQTLGQAATKSKLEAAVAQLGHTSTSSQLDDVFTGGVLYVTAAEVSQSVTSHTTTPEHAMALVARVVAEDSNLLGLLGTTESPGQAAHKIAQGSPSEWAAARALEPLKRAALQEALQQVQDATLQNTKLVPAFGALVDAVLGQAKDAFATSTTTCGKSALSTTVGKELAASLSQELISEWRDVLETQLQLLEAASFASFQQSLGQLRLGPTLPQQMADAAQTAARDFGHLAQPLVPKTTKGAWKARIQIAQTAFQHRLQVFCQDRLEAAEASGQFKPVPRKGVTIGMHWLLPKPFGNDYRQEPWQVHANDNLVYVPRRSTKVTEVPEQNVVTGGGEGDWRDAVVPSPAGKDMLYMQ